MLMAETATWAAVRDAEFRARARVSIAASRSEPAMAKPRTVFVCSSCGADAPRWSGQCPACGEWNTLAPFAEARARAGGRREGRAGLERPQPVARLVTTPEERLTTGIAEFDRVLGGGLVPGSVTLIGGEPGIGKSTLLLQCAAALAKDRAVL
jgi:DNA repair protein RadA/Sms